MDTTILSKEWLARIEVGYGVDRKDAVKRVAEFRQRLPPKVPKESADIVCECIKTYRGGRDTSGHLFWCESYQNLEKLEALPETEIVNTRILVTEKMLKELKSKFILIFNFEHFPVRDKIIRKLMKKLVFIANAYYPETVEKIYLINTSLYFRTTFARMKSNIDTKTRNKITFTTLSKLSQIVPLPAIPKAFGGTLPDDIIHDLVPSPIKSTSTTTTTAHPTRSVEAEIETKEDKTLPIAPIPDRAPDMTTQAPDLIPLTPETSPSEPDTTSLGLEPESANEEDKTTTATTTKHDNKAILPFLSSSPAAAALAASMLLFTVWFAYF